MGKEEGIEAGIKEGIKKGIEEQQEKVAQKLLEINMEIGQIAEITGLAKEEIEKLKENNKIKMLINLLEPIVIVILLLIVTAYLVDNSYNPFLYFRF